jgi:hypothetical protein
MAKNVSHKIRFFRNFFCAKGVLWGKTFWMQELCTFLKSAQNHPLWTTQVKSGIETIQHIKNAV